ncbi:MAG: deoxynucleoside kinase [Bacteroidota bacterium]
MKSSLPYSYIAIEGNIGAGKTSLAKIFSGIYNTDLVLEEFADNTFLPQFYENPERFAFPLEMSFLAERYQQLKARQESAAKNDKVLISDYLFEKSMFFANVNLKGNELDLFRKFFDLINKNLRQPDMILYLNKSTTELQKNINKRGRTYEQNIPSDYLEKISRQYQHHLSDYSNIPVLFVESDDIDFIENASDLRFLLELIQNQSVKGLQKIKK